MNTHKVEEEFQFCNCWTCRGEINRVCVDEGKRTIERCPHYEEPEKCKKFKPSTR